MSTSLTVVPADELLAFLRRIQERLDNPPPAAQPLKKLLKTSEVCHSLNCDPETLKRLPLYDTRYQIEPGNPKSDRYDPDLVKAFLEARATAKLNLQSR